jgi:outer membrane protein TolC
MSDPDLIVNTPAAPHNTIFYKQFLNDSLKLINTGRQIDLNYGPKLSVYADGGYLSALAYSPWKNFGFSAGLSVTVPIYDGRQKKMQHDQVAISETTRLNYLSFYTSQYRQQITMLMRQLASNEKLTLQIREQMAYTQTLVDANRLLLNSGDLAITDYLLSINNYLTAKNLMIENSVARFRILNEINYWNDK